MLTGVILRVGIVAVVVLCVPSGGMSVSSLMYVSSSVCGHCVFSAYMSINVAVSNGLTHFCRKQKTEIISLL